MSTSWTQEAGMTGNPDVDNVQDLAESASTSATSASNSATSASNSATSAANSATSAASSASGASTSASNASTSASNAASSATSAAASETNASSSESTASTKASEASTSATNAASSAASASTSASTATTQASNASTSATAAASSASAASTSATNAATSATNAATSETNAGTSETNAATSATNAANSATAAASSASAASTSASNASTSETNASTSASNASTSASNASTSETNAASSATSAASSATSAAASYDSFDDRYLGAKSSAPTLDNDGDALLTGALYYDTTASQLYIWTGSVWDQAAFSVSGSVTSFNTRTGAVTLTSTDVNTALGSDAVLDSDIGSTVQAYSSVLQNTTASYTTAEETKLAGIETAADVTDATNVAAAGAVMESDTSTSLMSFVVDEDNMTSNSATKIPTQQSVKAYVDTLVSSGIHYHSPVRVESPTALTVTYNNGSSGVGATLTNAGTQAAISIDGIALSLNDRVLVYTQTDATQNGVYYVSTVGDGATNWVLTRATDADSFGTGDSDALGEGDAFFVSEGNTGAGELYVMNTAGTITFGTTNISFTQIAATAVYSGGTNIDISGTTISLDTTSNVNFADNEKAVFGAGSDLQIYHDGSNSYIYEAGTGNLLLRGSAAIRLQRYDGTENFLTCDQDAAVTLYYNGASKLATTSTGVDVTGTVTADGLSLTGDTDITKSAPIVHFLDTATTDNNTRLRQASGGFYIANVDDSKTYVANRMLIQQTTGDISFYEDTGTTAKFFWDASAESLGIGTTSPATTLDVNGTVTANGLSLGDSEKAQFGASNDLQIFHDGSNSYVSDEGTGTLRVRSSNQLVLQVGDDAGGWENAILADNNAGVALRYNNLTKLSTTGTGVTVTGTMTSDGVSVGDNEYIYVGAGNDLAIWHDGTNTLIRESGAGGFYIDGTNLNLRNGTGTATYAAFANGGAATLYYNNGAKIATNSGGVTVTGTCTATSFSGSGAGLTGISGTITYTSGSPAYYGARSFINMQGDGTVAIRNSQNVSSIADDGTGLYTINFSTAMPDANFTVVSQGSWTNANTSDHSPYVVAVRGRQEDSHNASWVKMAAGVNYQPGLHSAARYDADTVEVAIFR